MCVRMWGFRISGCKLQPVTPQSVITALKSRTKGSRRGRTQEERNEGIYGSVCFSSARVCVLLLRLCGLKDVKVEQIDSLFCFESEVEGHVNALSSTR